jgi:hypothetical protein
MTTTPMIPEDDEWPGRPLDAVDLEIIAMIEAGQYVTEDEDGTRRDSSGRIIEPPPYETDAVTLATQECRTAMAIRGLTPVERTRVIDALRDWAASGEEALLKLTPKEPLA